MTARTRRFACLLFALALSVAAPLGSVQATGGPFQLFRDINTSPYSAGGYITDMVPVGDTLFLAVMEDAYGWGGWGEIWTSDGVPGSGNTSVLRDIRPGPYDSMARELVAIGSRAYFAATDGSRGLELWASDGGSMSTSLVSDIHPGPVGSDVHGLLASGDTLYFAANDGVHGAELWKSDGTAAGTVMVQDINPGAAGSEPLSLVAFRGGVAFSAADATAGRELWYSDGSAAHTYRVADIAVGPTGAVSADIVAMPLGGSERLYFPATDCGVTIACSGIELWTSTGDPGNADLVKDVYAGELGSYPTELAAIGSGIYFTAADATVGAEPWYSDGTTGGTHLIEDVDNSTAGSDPRAYTEASSFVYFVADDSSGASPHGVELWRTTGAIGSAELVADINPITGSSRPQNLTAYAGALYFGANSGTGNGWELWRTDGTTTSRVDLNSPTTRAQGANPMSMTVFTPTGGTPKLYLGAGDADGGSLWRLDDLGSGDVAVEQVQALRPWGMDSWVWGPALVGDTVFFAADDTVHGYELWATDGTVAGTNMVKDIFTLSSSSYANHSYPRDIVSMGGLAYFAATAGATGRELWRSDGTAAGTVLVEDIVPGTASSNPAGLVAHDGWLYFSANDDSYDTELWRSDGRPGGVTERVANIDPVAGSFPGELVEYGGKVYFRATDGAIGSELCYSDGTAAGTACLDLVAGPNGSAPGYLVASAGTLYFAANDAAGEPALWRSDGTLAGTTVVKSILIGSDGYTPANMVDVAGLLYFAGNDGEHGFELWRSDGSEAGTVMVRDIYPGPVGSLPTMLTDVNGYLVFGASDGGKELGPEANARGNEPWISDGTETGTHVLQDIISGTQGSNPESFIVLGDMLYFSADDGVNGQELWAGMPFRQTFPLIRR